MPLSVEQEILIEQRVANEGKSTGLAYVLWFFGGALGLHRLYIGETLTGIAMLLATPVGIALVLADYAFGVGLFAALAVTLVLDMFMIPSMINYQRKRLREQLTDAMIAREQS